ncbi:heavy-metal-associated domain-containing protein [Halomonas koreensis]|uniref:Heavy-metal-associated domain-containing protein n=1 Tax=Halomonas koreensis TaxID=245385 RepID=A0ABU1FZG1_9GAMM|nr:heavy-metal-associated domain-containing protein [Halomonas koreensis]MDR5866065.1 heavy-metal-associated domain-containing protein [Halomonas koreensis]
MHRRLRRPLLVVITLLLAASAYAAGPRYRLEVDGLACPFCAYGIEKRLLALEGVADVQIDIAEGAAIVTMDDGRTLAAPQAAMAVDRAGFTLGDFTALDAEAP